MAGRIRTIKPELLEDSKTAKLSDRTWRLFVSLILLADDHGRFRADEGLVDSQAFWGAPSRDPRETLANLLELLESGLVELYSVRGQKYGRLTGWEKHQKVDHPSKPRCPSQEEADPLLGSESLARPSRDPRALPPTTDHRPPTTTEDQAVAAGQEKIPCPAPSMLLSPGQRATLETAMIPGWGIDALLLRFAASAQANQADRRTLEVWRKCASKAVSGGWQDPKTRPKRDESEREVLDL